MKLEPDGVVAELAAPQPGPFDGVLAFLDVLLRFASLIVEGHHPLGGARQVSDDKADTRTVFARVPFHLGHQAPLPVPASSLIAEAGLIVPHMVRRTANGSREQMADEESNSHGFLSVMTGRIFYRLIRALSVGRITWPRWNGTNLDRLLP